MKAFLAAQNSLHAPFRQNKSRQQVIHPVQNPQKKLLWIPMSFFLEYHLRETEQIDIDYTARLQGHRLGVTLSPSRTFPLGNSTN